MRAWCLFYIHCCRQTEVCQILSWGEQITAQGGLPASNIPPPQNPLHWIE